MHRDDPSRLIRHETIYAAIYAQPKDALKAEMIAALRQHKPARGPAAHDAGRWPVALSPRNR